MHQTRNDLRAWAYSDRAKNKCCRAFDLAVAIGLAIPATIVIGASIPIILACNKGRSPFYSQQRVGNNGDHFDILKLRTFDDKGQLLKCAKPIRALKLDEWPQLWNIWKGDMSVIGVRPQMPRDQITQLYWRQKEPVGLFDRAKLSGGNGISHTFQAVLERREAMKRKKMHVGQLLAYNLKTCAMAPAAIIRQSLCSTNYEASGHSSALQFGTGYTKKEKERKSTSRLMPPILAFSR